MLPIVDPLLNKSKAEVEVVGKVKEPWPTKNRLQEGRRTVGKSLGLCHLWPSQDVNFYEHFFLCIHSTLYAYTVYTYDMYISYPIFIYQYLYIQGFVFFESTCTSTCWCWPFLYIRGKRGNVHIFLDMFKHTHTHEIPLYLWLYEASAWVGGNPWLFQ